MKQKIDLDKLSKKCWKIIRKREENGANLSTESWSLLKHLCSEVSEVHEAFAGVVCNQVESPEFFEGEKRNLENELGDVLVCVLTFAYNEELSIMDGLKRVIKQNKKRAKRMGDKL